MEKGIFTKDQEKIMAEALDNAIKLKGLAELLDGYAAKILIQLLDDNVIEKLKIDPVVKEKIAKLADAAFNKDIEACEELVAEIVNTLVDIPGIDEDGELLLFEGAAKLISGALKMYIKKTEE